MLMSLHPLVVANVSDHVTRAKIMQSFHAPHGIIAGALISDRHGQQQPPQHITIVDSFELRFLPSNAMNEMKLDIGFFHQYLSLLRDVHPHRTLCGYYVISLLPPSINVDSIAMNIKTELAQSCKDVMIFITFDSSAAAAAAAMSQGGQHQEQHESGLPIKAYASGTQPSDAFQEIQFKIESFEAERLCVEHILKQNPKLMASANDRVAQEHPLYAQIQSHYSSIDNAILMLSNQMRVIRDYLVLTRDGKVPYNHELVREIQSLCVRLPCLSDDYETLQRELTTKFDESMLLTYLSLTMKAATHVNSLINNFVEGGVGQMKSSASSSSGATKISIPGLNRNLAPSPPPLTSDI